MVFGSLELNGQQSEDTLLAAKDLVNELFRISRQRTRFRPLATYLQAKLERIKPNIPVLLEMKDVDLAAAYQDIFTDAAKSDIDGIVEDERLELPMILLDLMTVGCKAPQDHLLEINEERIEARR